MRRGKRLPSLQPVHPRRESDQFLSRLPGIQRGVAVLEHHLHLAAVFLHRQSRGPIDCPSNNTSPAVGCIRAMISGEVVDLPQPDSPTMRSVSPLRSSKLTPATACTLPGLRPSQPPLQGKVLG